MPSSVRCGREVRCSRGSSIAHSPQSQSIASSLQLAAQARRSLGWNCCASRARLSGDYGGGVQGTQGTGRGRGREAKQRKQEGPGASLHPGIEQRQRGVWVGMWLKGGISVVDARSSQGHNPLDDPGTLGGVIRLCRLMRLRAAWAARGRMPSIAPLQRLARMEEPA